MKIITLDVSSSAIGVAYGDLDNIISTHKGFTPKKKDLHFEYIYDYLTEELNKHEDVDVIVLEKNMQFAIGKSTSKTMLKLASVQAIALLAIAHYQRGKDTLVLNPLAMSWQSKLKKPKGMNSKEFSCEFASKITNRVVKSNDEADAICMLHWANSLDQRDLEKYKLQ